MKYYLLSLFAVCILLVPFGVQAQGDVALQMMNNGEEYIKGVVILKVKPQYRSACAVNSVDIPELKSIFESLEYKGIKKKFPNSPAPTRKYNDWGKEMVDITLIYELYLPLETDIFAAVKQLEATGMLEYAQADYVSYPMYIPNDSHLNNVMPYHFETTQTYQAWDSIKGDTSVIIGITETSFDVNHPELIDQIQYNHADPVNGTDDDNDGHIDNYAGWDFFDDDNNLFINNDLHGTVVAAIASARADNNLGYAGIGFNCRFMPVKVGNASTITKGYDGITYCVDRGCKVVNCSWGNTTFNPLAQDVINYAVINHDAVIVSSAGNADATAYYYPASYQYVLSVTSVDADDKFNNPSGPHTRNDSVDVCSPGYQVYSTATFNGTYYYSPPQGGTSIAAPTVSGVAALIRSRYPCYNAVQVIDSIKANADIIDTIPDNIPFAGMLGAGRVNAYKPMLAPLCSIVGQAEKPTAKSELLVYPNPAGDRVNININIGQQGNATIKLLNYLGQEVYTSQTGLQAGENRSFIDLSNISQGTYIVQVVNSDFSLSRKLIVAGK